MGGALCNRAAVDDLIVRCLNCNADGSRYPNYNYVDNNYNSNEPALGVGNSSHFSPGFLPGEFFLICLSVDPLHPPSILPASSILTDRAIYFLVSNDCVSQRIIKSTFIRSVFLMACPM